MGAQDKNAKLWIGGIVAYEINSDLGNIVAIHEAIRTLERSTNVRFVGRFIQEDYVRFSKQTQGNANSLVGRQGGRQFLNASDNNVGTLLHEIGHALGLMHEHQRADRDQFVIFHAERVTSDKDQYSLREYSVATPTYDYQSLMHYNVGDVSNPIFESRTGIPSPAEIGSAGNLTATDIDFLARIYPAPPVIRRSDGVGGAGPVLQNSVVAYSSVNNTVILANAIQNGAGNYQLILWRIRNNGVIRRMTDPQGATGGTASDVQVIRVSNGNLVSAMKNKDGNLLLISHNDSGIRLKDSAGQAGNVRALHLMAIPGTSRVLTSCVSASGRLLLIVWEIQADGTVRRLFDSGTKGPSAKTVYCETVAIMNGNGVLSVLFTNDESRLVLSTWRIDRDSIDFISDSGTQIGVGDRASVVRTSTGHLVVACRTEGSKNLLLIPFTLNNDGTDITRVSRKEAKAGRVREVVTTARPYGLLTSVISESGHVLLIKWAVSADGSITRLGESGTQAGAGSQLAASSLPFNNIATICTVVRNGSGDLLPISWDDADGPGELSIA